MKNDQIREEAAVAIVSGLTGHFEEDQTDWFDGSERATR